MTGWKISPNGITDFMNFYMDKTKRLLLINPSDPTQIIVQGATYGPIPMKVGSQWFQVSTDLVISTVSNMDTGTIAAAKDYYIYACNNNGVLAFLISLNATYPSGYSATTSRKIGGFHTLCVDVGTISGHLLTGFTAGQILPQSVWDLKFRANSLNNAGLVYDPNSKLWVQIYLASDDGASGVQSVYNAATLDTITWNDIVDRGGKSKMRCLHDYEFQLMARNSNEKTSITGAADPVTTGGHIDSASRRMISDIGVEDAAGAMNQWLLDQGYRYDVDAASVGDTAAGAVITVYYSATAGGNQLYVKWDNNIPYLCSNFATAQADKVLTFGTNQKFLVKHDADAATGGLPIYIKYDATNIWEKLLVNNTVLGKDVYVETNFPAFQIKLKHDASAATNGVALKYDDGADSRLEAVIPSSANTTFDLSTMGPAYGYYALAGNKGSIYRQGVYGDVKLAAGGYWSIAALAGSRYRYSSIYRWYTSTSLGGRFASEPI
ncbi:hypothetical protein [Methanobacterium spitsbergense]|uniref:Major tropism determinant second domain-containing protein n=1 Tax=Methanobacterium spitsbergense TaxID=2874285 RepID=A0A8T5UQL8_9EURY|nr:hypothetical protein [Methanobacterium spitsbergense]MBZ2166282.1 hypothetical protein [Methanobacterium spitsbergense]